MTKTAYEKIFERTIYEKLFERIAATLILILVGVLIFCLCFYFMGTVYNVLDANGGKILLPAHERRELNFKRCLDSEVFTRFECILIIREGE